MGDGFTNVSPDGRLVGVHELHRHFGKSGELGRGVAALAGDELVHVLVREIADRQRILDANGFDALGQFANLGVGHALVPRAHLVLVRSNAVNGENEQRPVGSATGGGAVLDGMGGRGAVRAADRVLKRGFEPLVSGAAHVEQK